MEYAVIFGLGPAGLFLGRQLAKQNFDVIGIGRHDDVGLYSKHIKGYKAESTQEIMKVTDELIKKSNIRPKAYICSDQYITLLLNEYPEIFNKLDFLGLNIAMFQLINSKNKVNEFCKEVGVLTPKTYTASEICCGKDLTYPIIFKLDSKHINEKKNPIGKTKIVYNESELIELMHGIENSNILKKDLVIQQFIPGNNAFQFSFGGYFKDGKELAGIVVNQIRQYPQGVSSLVIEVDNKELEQDLRQKVRYIAKNLNYSGFIEIEFKVCDKEIYVMDINPRPWGWVSILGEKFKNFNQLFSKEGAGKLKKRDHLIMWKSPIRNCIGYVRNPQNVKELKRVLNNKYSKKYVAYDIYDKEDLKPIVSILWVGIKKVLNKLG